MLQGGTAHVQHYTQVQKVLEVSRAPTQTKVQPIVLGKPS